MSPIETDDNLRQMGGQWFRALGISQEAFAANPYPVYRHWQRESPIKEVAPGQWMVLNYADVRTVLMDPRFVKRNPLPDAPPDKFAHLPEMSPSMLVVNPPAHTRLRTLVNRAFQPRQLERLRPFIEDLAENLLNEMDGQTSADLVEHFAFPLPALVIAELLGVPSSDRSHFRSLSQRIALMIDPTQSSDIKQAGAQARWELLDYFHGLVEDKMAHPGEDLLSALIVEQDQDGKLSAGEVLTMALLLLVAGHETTTNLISMGALRILNTPDALSALHADASLYPNAVEECLRFESPVQLDGRMAKEAVNLSGVEIPEGAGVTVVLAQANRDPEVFSDPDVFDIYRHPNPHMAFGRGIHICLGSALARMEGTIALQHLFQRPVTIDSEPVYNPNVLLRGLKSLKVAVSSPF